MTLPTLDLGDGLQPSAALLLERGFVAGSPKTGKTSTCVVLVEEADRVGINSAVVTPNDVWHGLRSSADGEGPGLDHVIFGGQYGDRPLQAGMGRGLARAVAGGLRIVVVLQGLGLQDRAELVADFCDELLEANRDPLLLVVDEAHLLAPNGSAGGGSADERRARARCRESLIQIAAVGRMPALIGLWYVTQRLARLATDLRELANASIVHRLRGNNDISAAREWLEDFLDEPPTEIAQLARGEAYVVAPEDGIDVAGRYQIRPKWTFDSSNSDDALAGKRREPKGRSTVDLSVLDATLGEALREAEDHDPEVLRTRVRALEAQLAKGAVRVQPDHAALDARFREGRLKGAQDVRDQLEDLRRMATEGAVEIRSAAELLGLTMQRYYRPEDSDETERTSPEAAASREDLARGEAPPPRRPDPIRSIEGGRFDGLGPGAQRVLGALARRHPLRFTRAQVAGLSKYKASGGAFAGALSELRRADLLLEVSGEYGVTEAGLVASGVKAPDPPRTKDEALAMWLEVLDPPEAKVLKTIHGLGGKVHRDKLAGALGMTASGGAFAARLAVLHRNDLIDRHRGQIQLAARATAVAS